MKQFTIILLLLIPILVYSQIKVFEEQTVPGQFPILGNYLPKLTAADIDHDDKIDILLIAANQIIHYEQESITANEFSLINENFLPIPINYNVVELIDLDYDGNFELLIGNQNTIKIYSQTDPNTYNYGLQNTTSLLPQSGEGWVKPYFTYGNLNGTGNSEMIVGFYNNSPTNPGVQNYSKLFLFDYDGSGINLLDEDYTDPLFLFYSSPCLTDYDHDDLLDLVVGSGYNLNYFEQEDINSLNFNYISTSFDDINNNPISFPYFCDINNDGIEDLLLGTTNPAEIRIFIRKLWVDFGFEQLSANTYQFYSNSIGEIETYQWDFNDDGLIDSNEENPQWTFNEAGPNQVSLEILNGIYHDINQTEIIIETGSDPDLFCTKNTYLTAFPNPFNPSTTIKFYIQNDSKIDLSIYNIKGQRIKTLAQNEFTKGSHSIIWNESDKSISSGIYYYKLNVNGKTEAVKKCILLK